MLWRLTWPVELPITVEQHSKRDRMPHYLVMHTSLVEAENEEAAARRALLTIKESKEISFSVKFDEASVRRVVVSTADIRCDLRPLAGDPEKREVETPADSTDGAPPEASFHAFIDRMKFAIALILFISGLFLGWAYRAA